MSFYKSWDKEVTYIPSTNSSYGSELKSLYIQLQGFSHTYIANEFDHVSTRNWISYWNLTIIYNRCMMDEKRDLRGNWVGFLFVFSCIKWEPFPQNPQYITYIQFWILNAFWKNSFQSILFYIKIIATILTGLGFEPIIPYIILKINHNLLITV